MAIYRCVRFGSINRVADQRIEDRPRCGLHIRLLHAVHYG